MVEISSVECRACRPQPLSVSSVVLTVFLLKIQSLSLKRSHRETKVVPREHSLSSFEDEGLFLFLLAEMLRLDFMKTFPLGNDE